MAAVEAASAILTQYAALARSLFDSLAVAADASQRIGQGGAGAADPAVITASLVEKEKELRVALRKLDEHQQFQRSISALKASIDSHDVLIRRAVALLSASETELEGVLDVAKERMASIRQAKAGAVDPAELVRYANFTSYSSAAPHGWQPNMPLGPYNTPFPTDVQMRSGLLYSVSESDAGTVGRLREDGVVGVSRGRQSGHSAPGLANGKRKRELSAERAPARAVVLDLNSDSESD
eukprot:Opistho-2@23987